MSNEIEVRCAAAPDGWACLVTVTGNGTSTTHDVAVPAADMARLAPGAAAPEDLVRRSFEFLLAREPKESILRQFQLTVIGRYFPDWEREVRRPG